MYLASSAPSLMIFVHRATCSGCSPRRRIVLRCWGWDERRSYSVGLVCQQPNPTRQVGPSPYLILWYRTIHSLVWGCFEHLLQFAWLLYHTVLHPRRGHIPWWNESCLAGHHLRMIWEGQFQLRRVLEGQGSYTIVETLPRDRIEPLIGLSSSFSSFTFVFRWSSPR